jgi:large conductance mechanosensitive channel
MGFFKEFKEFALRGNVIDLAVGVIIGGAFGKITTSLVNDMMMPVLGKVMSFGGQAVSIKDWRVDLFTKAEAEAAGLSASYTLAEVQAAKLPVLMYGSFIATVIDFLILAFCVFLMIKFMNMAMKRLEFVQHEKAAEAPPPEPPADVKLLTEIRDLLKAR